MPSGSYPLPRWQPAVPGEPFRQQFLYDAVLLTLFAALMPGYFLFGEYSNGDFFHLIFNSESNF